MTFVGVAALDPARAVTPALADQVRTRAAAATGGAASLSAFDRCAVAWWDSGSLPGASFHHGKGDFFGVAGYPLLTPEATLRERPADLARLADTLARADHDTLACARGTYHALRFDARSNTLQLLCDPLGVRPLAYAVRDGYLWFATSPALLGGTPSDNGAAQKAVLGFTIGAVTPLEGVRWLRPGELLCARDGRLESVRIDSWSEPQPAFPREDDWLDALTVGFDKAVRDQLVDDRHATAFLSGGLDSRLICTFAHRHGVALDTVSFGPDGSADAELARLFAQHIGSHHHDMREGPADFWSRLAAAADAQTRLREATGGATAVLSGHGGEALLAPARLTAQVIRTARSANARAVARAWLQMEGAGGSFRVMTPFFRRGAQAAVPAAVAEGIARMPFDDAARRLQFFGLVYELREQLTAHYAQAPLHRCELLLPFLDMDFVRTVLRGPLEALLYHRLYHRWVRRLGDPMTCVAWQTYPNHEPCWLPMPEGLRDQWRDGWHSREELRRERRALIARVSQARRSGNLPTRWLRPHMVLAAEVLCRLGIRRYEYVLEVTERLCALAGKMPGPPCGVPETRLGTQERAPASAVAPTASDA